jgi:hypothetical protein
MSDVSSFDFSKFVPGFDFLQKLSGTGTSTGMPSASSWIAPTLDPDELDKRIQELKTVHFWLDQNTKAVSATIQALEVQKMTLATLRGMNMSMSDLAESLKIKPDTVSDVFTRPESSTPSGAAESAPQAKPKTTTAARPAAKAKARPATQARQSAASAAADSAAHASAAAAAGVDPMAWWGSLTQQFQQIANQAVQDLQRHEHAASGDTVAGKTSTATRSTAGSTKGTAKPSSNKSKPARKSAHSAPRRTDP